MPIKTTFRNMFVLQETLNSLLVDVQQLNVHGHPTPSAFGHAPVLEDWSHDRIFAPSLTGRVTGHPLLGDNPHIHTSELILIDTEAGWARTFSRYYRLGSPRRPVR